MSKLTQHSLNLDKKNTPKMINKFGQKEYNALAVHHEVHDWEMMWTLQTNDYIIKIYILQRFRISNKNKYRRA